jgi:hypothetical protein
MDGFADQKAPLSLSAPGHPSYCLSAVIANIGFPHNQLRTISRLQNLQAFPSVPHETHRQSRDFFET